MNRMQHMQDELNTLTEKIVINYQPEKMILFGSAVSGKTHDFSDIDLAVIKRTHSPFIDRLRDVAKIIGSGIALDLLVYTPEEYEQLKATSFFVRHEIDEKGKVIYDRSAVA